MEDTRGKTRNAGWQVGARKTFDLPKKRAWELMFSPEGLAVWLGDVPAGDFMKGKPVETAFGMAVRLRLIRPGSHVRMDWRRPGWENTSLLQVRVMHSASRTVVSFHQEKLRDKAQREVMKAYWRSVLGDLETFFRGAKAAAPDTGEG